MPFAETTFMAVSFMVMVTSSGISSSPSNNPNVSNCVASSGVGEANKLRKTETMSSMVNNLSSFSLLPCP